LPFSKITQLKQAPKVTKNDIFTQTIQPYETSEEKDIRLRLENELKEANFKIDDLKTQSKLLI
jgi:hypothetical protein